MKSRRRFLKQAGMLSAATLLVKPSGLFAAPKHRHRHIHRIGPPHHSPDLKRFLDRAACPAGIAAEARAGAERRNAAIPPETARSDATNTAVGL
jgi:hypothetical protein